MALLKIGDLQRFERHRVTAPQASGVKEMLHTVPHSTFRVCPGLGNSSKGVGGVGPQIQLSGREWTGTCKVLDSIPSTAKHKTS